MFSSLRLQLRAGGILNFFRPLFLQPQAKTPTLLFADFFSYLLSCARLYIANMEGQETWNSVKENIDFILVIPNGWGKKEKEDLRLAAIRGDLIPNYSNRLRFVKKGEATLHFGNHSDEELSISLKVLPASIPVSDRCLILLCSSRRARGSSLLTSRGTSWMSVHIGSTLANSPITSTRNSLLQQVFFYFSLAWQPLK